MTTDAVQSLNPEAVAETWTTKIGNIYRRNGMPEDELAENIEIIRAFSRVAVELAKQEPTYDIPELKVTVTLTPELVEELIDYFLRGSNFCAKCLRDTQKPWEERRELLEKLGPFLFNMARTMLALKQSPNDLSKQMFKSERDYHLAIRESASELLRKFAPEAAPKKSFFNDNIKLV
jgi:hypothetical protein